ncbi:integral membrane sensor signal transduction histidine kinase [Dehalogenimonas lykanthroporepellens BL-DC-9]|nr:integral membrane sensor signal transduction histidine kinase [Dehalogenimonas lykanthroporepellens BL-DC-9]
MSVKLKLTFVYTTVMALTLVAAGWISVALLSSGLSHNLSESLRTDFDRAKAVISLSPDHDLVGILEELESQIPGSAFIYDSESETLLGNPSVADDIHTSLTDFIFLGTSIQLREWLDGHLRMGIGQYNESDPGKFLVVTRDSSYIGNMLEEYRNVLFAAIPLALVVSGISGFFLAHNSLRQVRVITDTAEKIDPAKLEDRIPVKHEDELGRLSGTLNALFDRIHGFIDRQYRFTANASHDLTSPLTVIKAETDLALMKERNSEEYRQALTVVSGQVGRMRLIVEDLLTLAGLDAGPVPQDSRELNLATIAREVVSRWETPIKNKDIELTQYIEAETWIYGNNLQFDNLFDNLLSNAVKYTPPGGKISLTLEKRNGEIIISITDTGIGISPEHLPHLGERFYRIDRRVEGTGLGLSIVQGTAQIYRGRMEVESAPGEGATFTIRLPLASEER